MKLDWFRRSLREVFCSSGAGLTAPIHSALHYPRNRAPLKAGRFVFLSALPSELGALPEKQNPQHSLRVSCCPTWTTIILSVFTSNSSKFLLIY
jgi:hypothetical protein